jgi:DNA integrity scanning protein DisA with diadenylate cyclase activity
MINTQELGLKKQLHKPVNNQKGMTFIGMIIVVAAIAFFAMLGLKVMPAYLEFMNIKNAVKKISNEGSFSTMSKKEIADAFDRSAQIDDFNSVTGKDLIITKTDAGNVVSAEYQKLIPIFANASVLLDFNASSAK